MKYFVMLCALCLAQTSSLALSQSKRLVAPRDRPLRVAFVLTEAATMIDFAGPREVFSDVRRAREHKGASAAAVWLMSAARDQQRKRRVRRALAPTVFHQRLGAHSMTQTPVRILVVDDEPLARTTLRLLLQGRSEVETLAECSGVQAARQIRALRPHIVFLDVQMPEVDGFQVLAEVGPDAVPVVVFVTAYDQHALRAFEVRALDYLLKPFDDARFELAYERALRALQPSLQRSDERLREQLIGLLEHGAAQGAHSYVRRFAVRGEGLIRFIRAADVDWIEAADYYACLHTGSTSHLLRESMSELERRLDPSSFFRIHRSAIINLERVRELRPLAKGDYTVLLEDGPALRISRSRLDELQRRLERSA
jgi:two-component system, LytTR family, response regulator